MANFLITMVDLFFYSLIIYKGSTKYPIKILLWPFASIKLCITMRSGLRKAFRSFFDPSYFIVTTNSYFTGGM